MNNIKEMATKFMDGMTGKDYPFTSQTHKIGKLTKVATIMLAGTVLAGCASSGNQYQQQMEEQRDQAIETLAKVSSIEPLNMDAVKKIADGESGFFKDESGTVIIVSNFDNKESLSKEQKYAYSQIVPPNNDYKDSSLTRPSKYQPYAFIKINHDEFDSLIANTKSPYLQGFVDSGDIPSFIGLHELSHRLNNAPLEDMWDAGLKNNIAAKVTDLSESTIDEYGADTGGVLLLAKQKGYEYNQALNTMKALRDIREQNAFHEKDTTHDTTAPLNALIKTMEENPSLYNKIVNSSVTALQKASIDLVAASSMNQEKADQLRIQVKADITKRLEDVALGNPIDQNSIISQLENRSKIVFDYFDYAESQIIENNNGQHYDSINESAQYDIDQMVSYIERGLGENLALSYHNEDMKSIDTKGVAKEMSDTIDKVHAAEEKERAGTLEQSQYKYSHLKLKTSEGYSM